MAAYCNPRYTSIWRLNRTLPTVVVHCIKYLVNTRQMRIDTGSIHSSLGRFRYSTDTILTCAGLFAGYGSVDERAGWLWLHPDALRLSAGPDPDTRGPHRTRGEPQLHEQWQRVATALCCQVTYSCIRIPIKRISHKLNVWLLYLNILVILLEYTLRSGSVVVGSNLRVCTSDRPLEFQGIETQ